MRIELGSVGRAVSVAPSIGRVASFGPRMGIEMPKSFMTPRAQAFAREFAPIRIPVSEAPRLQFRVADVIAEAQRIVSAAKKPAILERRIPSALGLPNPARGLDVRVIRNPFKAPTVETRSAQVPRVEVKPQARVRKVVFPSPASQVRTEQVVEERKIAAQERKEDKPQTKKSEKISLLKITLVKAVRVAENRISKLTGAIKQVGEMGKKFTFKDVKRFLIWSREDLSPIVKSRGFDGTLKLTMEALDSDTKEYSSVREATAKSAGLVELYKPVEAGEGNPVTVREVRQVTEGKKAEVETVSQAAGMVIKRVFVKAEVTGEPTLKTLGLEELFPKAA